MLEVLRRLVKLGVDLSLPARLTRHIVLTNAAALFGIVVSALALIAFLLAGRLSVVPVTAAQVVLWTIPLLLNRRKHPALAVVALLSIGILIVVALSVVYGPEPRHRYFLLPLATAAFFLFPERNRAGMYVMTVASGAAFMVLELFGSELTVGWLAPKESPFGPFIAAGVLLTLVWVASYSRRGTLDAEAQVVLEHQRSERLLRNMLPESIARRLKDNPGAIADRSENVTVLFADLCRFTELSNQLPPEELVQILNRIFQAFDDLAQRHRLEKIKTIGDAYLAVAGLPQPNADHAAAAARMALDMLAALERIPVPGDVKLGLRVGLSTGPVVAGVIGHSKFAYDLWGDTVNTASRMESHGDMGRVHISEATRALLGEEFTCEARGEIQVKGKGVMRTFWLSSTRERGPEQ